MKKEFPLKSSKKSPLNLRLAHNNLFYGKKKFVSAILHHAMVNRRRCQDSVGHLELNTGEF